MTIRKRNDGQVSVIEFDPVNSGGLHSEVYRFIRMVPAAENGLNAFLSALPWKVALSADSVLWTPDLAELLPAASERYGWVSGMFRVLDGSGRVSLTLRKSGTLSDL